MWKQISYEQAASILAAGGRIDDGFYSWAGSLELVYPWRWRKARKLKQLQRKLRRTLVSPDGWWYYDKG